MRLIFSTWRKSGSGFQDSNPLRELVIGVEIEHVFIGWNLLYSLNDGAGIEQIFIYWNMIVRIHRPVYRGSIQDESTAR